MGKYDMNSVYDEKAEYTLYDLVADITEELDKQRYGKKENDNTLNYSESREGYKKVVDNSILHKVGHDGHGSGMLDKLNKLFGFDLEKATEPSKRESFEMLRLLKLMYYIEKWDGKGSDYGESLQITDLLAKPRPSNIVYSGPNPTKYSNIIYELFEGLKQWVNDADSRCEVLDDCNIFWKMLIAQNFKYVCSTGNGVYQEKEYEELLSLNEIVATLYDGLKSIPESAKCRAEDIWSTFFNIVYCHMLLCHNHAMLTLDENIYPDMSPSREYIEKFKEAEYMPEVSLEILPELDKRIQGKSKNGRYDKIIRLITFDQYVHPQDIPENDRQTYHYAIEHAPAVIKMWQSNEQIEYTENVAVDLLCAVIQEIYWCKKNNSQIPFDGMDYKNGKKSMLRVLSNPQEADLVVKYAWIFRLENRLCVNSGALEHLQLIREIEHTIYKIMEIIFSYRNINDILFVNSFLENIAARMLIRPQMAAAVQTDFCLGLLERIHEIGNYDVEFAFKNIDILDMFRDFMISERGYWESIENLAVKLCEIFDACQKEEFILEYTITFPNYPEGIKERCLTLRGCLETQRIEFIDYKYVMSEEYKARAIDLGLEALVKDMIDSPSEGKEN